MDPDHCGLYNIAMLHLGTVCMLTLRQTTGLLMFNVYSNMESILTFSIAVWHAVATAKVRNQQITDSPEMVFECNLQFFQDLYAPRALS